MRARLPDEQVAVAAVQQDAAAAIPVALADEPDLGVQALRLWAVQAGEPAGPVLNVHAPSLPVRSTTAQDMDGTHRTEHIVRA